MAATPSPIIVSGFTPAQSEWIEWAVDEMDALGQDGRDELYEEASIEAPTYRDGVLTIQPHGATLVLADLRYRLEDQAPDMGTTTGERAQARSAAKAWAHIASVSGQTPHALGSATDVRSRAESQRTAKEGR